MHDFRRFFWLTTARRFLHKSVIFPRQRHCLMLLRKEQIASTNQLWLFAESVEHIVKKSGNTKKNKHLPSLSFSQHEMEQSPDFLIAGLRDIYQKRLTIQSDLFIDSILLPLESKNGNLVEFLQRSADTHVPFLLSLCGLPMSDATCSVKSVITDRFWKALIHANIPISHAAVKSRLRILIENEHTFDALEMLKEIETTFNLKPDEELFTIILRELSMTGSISAVNSMIMEIKKRRLPVNMEMKVSQIYCYLKNDDNNAMELVQNAITEYGNEIEPLIFMVRCQTAIEKRNIQNFKLLLDSLSSSDLSLKLLTDEMVMKFVWLLARNGIDSMGKDHERLCIKILREVRKERGFFKLMVREANRHAVHGMFYSALSYFHTDLHISTKSSFKGENLGRHMEWISCFSKALTNAKLSLGELKALFTHINRNTQHAHFLLEHVLYCILTHKFLSVHDSLLLTSELLKILDPNCTKIHVVVPLLVRATEVEQRLEILAHFVSLGYNDLNHLNYGVVRKLVLQPLLEKDNTRKNKWNTEQLVHILNIIKEYKIPEDIAYKLLEPVAIGISNLEKWLKEQSARNKIATVRNSSEISSSTLKAYISNQDVDKIHEFIKTNSLIDSSELFQPIIMLYIRKADWNTLMEYIKQIQSDGNLIQLTIDNILLIVARHLKEFRNFSMTSDFVYYLQQFVPKNLHSNIRDQKTLRKLIKQSLELSQDTVQSLITCSQMFRTLADVKWIQSGFFEIISTSFTSAALTKFGFEEALKVCSFFQFSDFPNGIIYLLHYAIRIDDENLINKTLALAKTYWPEWKVSVTFVSVLISLEKLEEASRQLQKTSIRWINAFHTYKLLCALHLDETHNFHFNYLSIFSKALEYNRQDEAFTRLSLGCLKNSTRKDPDQAYLVKHFIRNIGNIEK
ncbi:Uncharacterized protein BM_BM17754 [Brugia malayi]|uniref:Uncharacterized protein n=1 Tax=Brugia malayi TaxID=6279 RepID=A0A4E9FNW2_BRUMA|nr:Uncharacterized protein BM_BM17754 [Brugia malayi]VIO98176.1 Uncharacterized protein BM_BM17754 [Brugia malayi]